MEYCDFPSAHQIRKRTLPPSAFIEVVRPKRTNIESLLKIVVLFLSCCFKQQEQHSRADTCAEQNGGKENGTSTRLREHPDVARFPADFADPSFDGSQNISILRK